MKNVRSWGLSAVAALVLAACGGGGDGDQTPRVTYSALVSFGDSLSDVGTYGTVALKAATGGGKYTVNGPDGKMTGLVLTDETVSSAVKNPGVTFIDVVTPACDTTKAPTVTACTTATLVNALTSGDPYLWADTLHLSSGGQRAMGALAVTRATGNPF